MGWFDWFLVGWWLLNAAVRVSLIGKPRKPFSPADGVAVMILVTALIAGLLYYRL